MKKEFLEDLKEYFEMACFGNRSSKNLDQIRAVFPVTARVIRRGIERLSIDYDMIIVGGACGRKGYFLADLNNEYDVELAKIYDRKLFTHAISTFRRRRSFKKLYNHSEQLLLFKEFEKEYYGEV
jgi:hypothetical protein